MLFPEQKLSLSALSLINIQTFLSLTCWYRVKSYWLILLSGSNSIIFKLSKYAMTVGDIFSLQITTFAMVFLIISKCKKWHFPELPVDEISLLVTVHLSNINCYCYVKVIIKIIGEILWKSAMKCHILWRRTFFVFGALLPLERVIKLL